MRLYRQTIVCHSRWQYISAILRTLHDPFEESSLGRSSKYKTNNIANVFVILLFVLGENKPLEKRSCNFSATRDNAGNQCLASLVSQNISSTLYDGNIYETSYATLTYSRLCHHEDGHHTSRDINNGDRELLACPIELCFQFSTSTIKACCKRYKHFPCSAGRREPGWRAFHRIITPVQPRTRCGCQGESFIVNSRATKLEVDNSPAPLKIKDTHPDRNFAAQSSRDGFCTKAMKPSSANTHRPWGTEPMRSSLAEAEPSAISQPHTALGIQSRKYPSRQKQSHRFGESHTALVASR